MSSPPGLFYAYAKQTTTDWAYRYMIIFANRATADEWWRAVIDSVASGYQRFSGVKRITSQFYIHDPNVDYGNIMETINDDRCAKKFLGRVFFTLLNDRDGRIIDIAPVLNFTDHISGRGFFIRSSVQGNQCWFFDGQRLVISRTHRTKFTVEIADNQRDGQVMIGTDRIIISLFESQNFLHVQTSGQLTLGPGPSTPIKFSQFDGGFLVTDDDSLLFNQVEGGDRWELV